MRFMQKLINFFFTKKRFTIVFSTMLLIFGIQSYKMIAKEGAPQVKVPYIFISVQAEGFSPRDSEKMILKPIEKEISKIQGVKNVTSYSYVNSASVVIEFNAGIDNATAMNDVREKVDAAKVEFPTDVKEPAISEVDLSAMPVLNIALLSDNLNSTMEIARNLKDAIENIPDVLKVTIKGELEEVVEIQILPSTLRQFGISIQDIAAIANNNKLISSGIMRSKSGEFSVTVPSLIKDFEEIKNLPVKTKNGTVVKLKDIANVVKTYKDQSSIAKINGKNAIVLEISKRSGTNIIKTIEKIYKKIDVYASTLSSDVEILYMRDTSQDIKDSLSNLQNEIMFAIIIVFIMVMNIVGLRQAILIGLSVPLSFFISIWILYMFGISLNIIVLFGLVLSIGMIMDASSIIVEYASQKIRYGVPVKRAYLEATQKMFVPALISTSTVLIVSAPLLAFPGVIGGFMKYLPMTLIIVLSSSLFVALFIMPTLGGILDKPVPSDEQDIVIEDLSTKEMMELDGIKGLYARMVYKTLQKPLISFFGLVGLIAVIITIYAFFNRGVEFFPNIETNYIRGFVRGTGNISLDEKAAAMDSVSKKVKEQIGSEIDVFYTFAGGTGGNAENMPKDTIGVIDIQLVDWSIRRKAGKIIEDLQENVTESGFIVTFEKEKDGPPQTTDIYYEIFGDSSQNMQIAVQEMREHLNSQPMLQNVEDTRPPERIEYQVIVDKQLAMKYDIDAAVIAGYVKLATNGVLMDKYSPNYLDEKSEILLRYPIEERNIARIMNSFLVKNGKSIPISNFIKVVKAPELVEVMRKNGRLMIAVKANVKEKYTDENGKVISVIKSKEKEKIFTELEKIAKKHSVELFAGGTDEDQQETMAFLKNAFLIALFAIFLIFLIEFNSFGYAAIIMSSVFLSIVGVLLGLVISQNPLSIVMCGIGIIALAGIVVSNNLIYLDFFQTFKKDIKHESDEAIKEALIKAALLRAKPILLTSATNVVGLLPAMFGIGISFETAVLTLNSPTSQWWIQLSSAIAGGLTFSTILTLFFTPSKVLLYLKFRGYVKKISARFSNVFRNFELLKKAKLYIKRK